jgi:hypothetical protein
MKNLIKYTLILVIGGVFMSSCEDKVSNWNEMTNDYDANNTTYFIQFLNATAYYETAINEAGLPTDIIATIGIALLGAPQSSDVNVTLVVDPSSTISASMYTLSADAITIPAGSTSGSVTLTTIADEMPEDEVLDLVLNMDAGGSESSSAFQLNYSLKRIKFCSLLDLNDLAGSWSGTDSEGNSSKVVTFVEGDNFMVDGLNEGWMTGYWGEVIVTQTPLVTIMNPNGTLEIELQDYTTTTWNGDPQPGYAVSATGKWDNCKKTLIIDYDLYQGGGLVTSITENISLN